MLAIDRQGIYYIRHIESGRVYVGSTTEFRRRMNVHFSNLRVNKHHCTYLQNVFNKYGEKSLEFNIILICETSQLRYMEQKFIDMIVRVNGRDFLMNCDMNVMATGLRFKGMKHSEETKKKMSEIQRTLVKTCNDNTRRKLSECNLGIKRSDLTRIKMSEVQVARREMERLNGTNKLSKEHIEKLRIAGTGRKYNEVARKSMKDAQELRRRIEKENGIVFKCSDETRAKMSLAHKGRKCSDETRAKLLITSTGRLHTDRTKEKMVTSQRNRRKRDFDELSSILNTNSSNDMIRIALLTLIEQS